MAQENQLPGVLPIDWGGSTDGAAGHAYTVYSVVLDNDYRVINAQVVPAGVDVGKLKAFIGVVAGGSDTSAGGTKIAQQAAFPGIGTVLIPLLQDPNDPHFLATLNAGPGHQRYHPAFASKLKRGKTLVIVVQDTTAGDAVTRTWQAQVDAIPANPETEAVARGA